MDEAFPFSLPPEPELLVLAYAVSHIDVLREFDKACEQGQLHLARRLAAVFELTAYDVRAGDNYTLGKCAPRGAWNSRAGWWTTLAWALRTRERTRTTRYGWPATAATWSWRAGWPTTSV